MVKSQVVSGQLPDFTLPQETEEWQKCGLGSCGNFRPESIYT
jgi:hypothetical protein